MCNVATHTWFATQSNQLLDGFFYTFFNDLKNFRWILFYLRKDDKEMMQMAMMLNEL